MGERMEAPTKKCPICGATITRKRGYKHGRDNGWAPWPDTCSRECGQRLRRGDPAERFWSNVDRKGPDDCWPWKLGQDNGGYGWMGWRGELARAHRVAWALTHNDGVMPTAKVLHSCDNRPCCNPAHLRTGTQAENMADMKERGGRKGVLTGAENGRAKITAEDVQEIRSRLRNGDVQQSIANDYGLEQTTISSIKRGIIWSHLPDTTPAIPG